jgi:hypothetical protein
MSFCVDDKKAFEPSEVSTSALGPRSVQPSWCLDQGCKAGSTRQFWKRILFTYIMHSYLKQVGSHTLLCASSSP